MICVIYALKNNKNDKIYIGQSIDLVKRWNRGHGYQGSPKIWNAIQKYGKEVFYYEILAYCENIEEANDAEIYYVEKFNSVLNGYNCQLGGKSGMKGFKHTPEAIKKMSESHLGNQAHLGYNHSAQTKEVLSQKAKQQFLEKGHPTKGKPLSAEHIEKMRQSKIGKRVSVNTEFKSKYTPNQIENIKNDILQQVSNKEIIAKYKMSPSYLSMIKAGKRLK